MNTLPSIENDFPAWYADLVRRAGLAENAEDYPFSGPAERLLGEAGRLSDEAALGGQSLSSVRTDFGALGTQA